MNDDFQFDPLPPAVNNPAPVERKRRGPKKGSKWQQRPRRNLPIGKAPDTTKLAADLVRVNSAPTKSDLRKEMVLRAIDLMSTLEKEDSRYVASLFQ